MKLNRTGAALIGGVVALVLGSGTAYAATGGTFLLGKANKATTLTTLTNTAGTPLSLVGKTGAAPLKVASSTKVANLNADKLDGLDSKTFLRTTGKAADANKLDGLDSSAFARANGTTGSSSDYTVGYVTGPSGQAVLSEATCPVGTQLTGGGYDNFSTGSVLSSSPTGDMRAWDVLVTSTGDPSQLDNVSAYVICFNPTGAYVQPAAPAVQGFKVGGLRTQRFTR